MRQRPEPVVTLSGGQQVELASAAARGVARIIDSLVHAALGIGGMALIFLATFCIFCANHETNSGQAALGALALVGWVLYEPAMVAWRGQTLGKAICGIKIVRVSNRETPSLGQAILRWAIPLAAGAALSVVAAMVITNLEGTAMRFGTVARIQALFAAWAPMYLTSFLDMGGQLRGWHDKAARTIVIRASDAVQHVPRPRQPDPDDWQHGIPEPPEPPA